MCSLQDCVEQLKQQNKVVAIQFLHDVQECAIFSINGINSPLLDYWWVWITHGTGHFHLSLPQSFPSRITNAQLILNISPLTALSIALLCLRHLHAILGKKQSMQMCVKASPFFFYVPVLSTFSRLCWETSVPKRLARNRWRKFSTAIGLSHWVAKFTSFTTLLLSSSGFTR